MDSSPPLSRRCLTRTRKHHWIDASCSCTFSNMGGGDMDTCDSNGAHRHGITQLCDAGQRLYASALRSGRIPRSEVEPAPCLMDFALLHPDPDDPDWLRPVPPSAALAQRLHPIEREIQERRRHSLELAESFEPFMDISAQDPPTTHAITVLEGGTRINAAIDVATAECRSEVLTVQPGGVRSEDILSKGLERGTAVVDRGVSIRTLYQHTVRHHRGTFVYAERLAEGKVEIRTLEELIERLIIFDGTVAFIPAQDDRQVALELRHPGLVSYLTKVFEQLWQRADPLLEEIQYDPVPTGISGVQRSIAQLLVEGHV